MASNFKALAAVTATGAGTAVLFRRPLSNHSMQIKLGGTVAATAVIVELEATLDKTNYYSIATWDLASGQADKDIVVSANVPVVGLRANLTTLTGGTAPTVTATIASGD